MDRKSLFEVQPRLMTIDGPDGSGKSTISKLVLTELEPFWDTVVLRPACFTTSLRAQEIGRRFRGLSSDVSKKSQLHNSFFLEAMEANYDFIGGQLLDKRRVVVCDSSEIRALAFMFDNGSEAAILDTKNRIEKGLLTNGTQAGVRIILDASASDLWKNLNSKPVLDYGDPQNIIEVDKRRTAYRESIEFLRQCDLLSGQCIRIVIRHAKNIQEYIEQLVQHELLPEIRKNLQQCH